MPGWAYISYMDDNGLQHRVSTLERQLRFAIAAWAITIAALLLGGWQSRDRHDVITAKRLVIEDARGVPRLILGAPSPDPTMHGKVQKRRSPFSGLVLNDASGDERGGIGMMDDGTMSMCFDQNGRERVCSYVLPNGKAGVLVSDAQGRDRVSMASEPDGAAALRLFDEQQRPVASFPERK
jgi:hypothetical protein